MSAGFPEQDSFPAPFLLPREGWQTDSMGPAFDPTRISTREMIGELVAFLEREYGVHYIELACAGLDPRIMRDMGFHGKPLFTYRVTLFPGDEERVMRNIKPKTRNQLRKAMRLGLIARIEHEESFVDEFYEQLKEVFARRGSVVPFGRNRVLQLFRHMRSSGNLLAISIFGPDNNVCMATGVFLVHGQELILWGWTHRYQYRWYCPTELLVWTAMQKAMEVGCTTFDMGGGGDAKVKFGAQADETVYRWIRSRYKWITQFRELARKAFKWQQSVRGRIVRRMIFGKGSHTRARETKRGEENDG